MPLVNYACEGTLTIGGVSMNTPAWSAQGDEEGEGGLLPLWVFTSQRGEDRLLPSAAGIIAYKRRETVTRHDIRLLVVGDVDQSGTPYTDATEGLAANLDYLESNVIQPTNLTDGTRAATLSVPGLATRSANIHVLGLIPQRYHLGSTEAIMIGTLQISIPSGRFT